MTEETKPHRTRSDESAEDNEHRPESDQEDLAGLIGEVLALTCGSVEDLATEAGISKDSLYAWASGRRRPQASKIDKLLWILKGRVIRLRIVHEQIARAAGYPPTEATSGSARELGDLVTLSGLLDEVGSGVREAMDKLWGTLGSEDDQPHLIDAPSKD